MNQAWQTGLWPRRLCYLALLGLFFFSSYGAANWLTAQRSDVGVMVMAWERYIPIWPWTIVPYSSIDLMYAVAVLWTVNRQQLSTLVRRLFTVQLICVLCFLLFPLHFSFERPPQSGFFGAWFDLLMGFDMPYNQAPSLHIALLVVLWTFYADKFSGFKRLFLHGWCFLIGVSVLTTWQHHFFDVPTGALAGAFAVWLWPENQASPLSMLNKPKQYRLALYYACAVLLLVLGIACWGAWWWLGGYLALSLLLLAGNYAFFNAAGFQKNAQGQYALCVRILFWPYQCLAQLNRYLWTRKEHDEYLIIDGVYLGRLPSQQVWQQWQQQGKAFALLDMCAELPAPKGVQHYAHFCVLDLTVVDLPTCKRAAAQIEQWLKTDQQTVLVSCALGYSRSAAVVAAWLLMTQRVKSAADALMILQKRKEKVVLSQEQMKILQALES